MNLDPTTFFYVYSTIAQTLAALLAMSTIIISKRLETIDSQMLLNGDLAITELDRREGDFVADAYRRQLTRALRFSLLHEIISTIQEILNERDSSFFGSYDPRLNQKPVREGVFTDVLTNLSQLYAQKITEKNEYLKKVFYPLSAAIGLSLVCISFSNYFATLCPKWLGVIPLSLGVVSAVYGLGRFIHYMLHGIRAM